MFNVFVPSLIFIKLLPSISPGKVPDWWPILVVPVVAVVLGVALGWLTCLVLRLPREVWGIVLVATALSNMGNLPLVLVQSLAEDPNSPLFGMGELAIAYVAFALIFVTLSHFSIGFYLLKPPPLPAAHKSPSRSAVAPPSRVGSETDSAAPSPPSSPRLPTPGARAGRSDRADSADGRAMSGEALEVEQAAAAEPMDRLPYDVVLPDRYEERRGGYRIFIQRIVKSMRPGRGKKRPG